MPLHEGGMEVLTDQEKSKDTGNRRPLFAGISMRSKGRGPWTSAVEAPQNHELRLLSYAITGIYARCLEVLGEGPGKITSHSNPPKSHPGKEPGQRQLLRREKRHTNEIRLNRLNLF